MSTETIVTVFEEGAGLGGIEADGDKTRVITPEGGTGVITHEDPKHP